ncbi:MAG: hypothetical protein ACRYFU_01180 [Janthinobacterium lividum]
MLATRQNAAHLRQQVEQDLAHRVPSALSPRERLLRERMPIGIEALDDLLGGGVPVGALTELVGPEGSGRTSFATSLLAGSTGTGGVCAWVDVADVLDPLSAATGGIDLERLLWVRCGLESQGKNLRRKDTSEPSTAAVEEIQGTRGASLPGTVSRAPQGGHGSPHPRSEARGMPEAVSALLAAQPRSSALPAQRRDRSIGTPSAPNRPLPSRSSDREEQISTDRLPPRRGQQLAKAGRSSDKQMPPRPLPVFNASGNASGDSRSLALAGNASMKRGWTALDQALRATDLLLQSGGFSLLVLDLGSTPAEMSWRIPLATWFRFRAACDRTRTSLLILTQHPCARSSAELVLRLESGQFQAQGNVLTGITYRAELERQRFVQAASNVISIRKPVQREPGQWKGCATWAIQA